MLKKVESWNIYMWFRKDYWSVPGGEGQEEQILKQETDFV